MGIEDGKHATEYSDAEWEKLREGARSAYDLALSKSGDSTSASCQHILKNLANGLLLAIKLEIPREDRARVHALVSTRVGYIKKYMLLLQDFPWFAEKEQTSGKGFFPEILSRLSNPVELVDAYEAQLRK